jgi:hypothetical protein
MNDIPPFGLLHRGVLQEAHGFAHDAQADETNLLAHEISPGFVVNQSE